MMRHLITWLDTRATLYHQRREIDRLTFALARAEEQTQRERSEADAALRESCEAARETSKALEQLRKSLDECEQLRIELEAIRENLRTPQSFAERQPVHDDYDGYDDDCNTHWG